MSLKSGIFNSTTVETTASGLLRGNKAVDAAFLAKLFSCLVTNGVSQEFGGGFASAVTDGTMKIVTSPGACFINGYFAYDDARETRSFAASAADRTAARILRLDLTDGSIKVLWRECMRYGNTLLSKEDGLELPIRSGNVYDLVTCVVDIPANTAALTQDMVTDTRGDATLCGFCHICGA